MSHTTTATPDPDGPTPPATTAHIDVMDGLRALAIAWVVALHIWQISWLHLDVWVLGWHFNFNHLAETGFSGVELFFFVSGFCLFYPYVRARLEARPWPGLGHYVYRRALKILPSYWLAIALLLLYTHPTWVTHPPLALRYLGTHLTFTHNLFHDTEAAINGVFWSLGVEVQFYLIFPLLAWCFVRRPALTYGAMCLAAIIWRANVETTYFDDFRFLMDQLPGYLDLFANGMLAATMIGWLRQRDALPAPALEASPKPLQDATLDAPSEPPQDAQPAPLAQGSPKMPVGAFLASLVAIGSVLAINAMMQDLWVNRLGNPAWPWTWQVEHRYHLALTFCILAVAASRALPDLRAWLAAPAMVFLSTISYNLYLYHQFIGRELAYTWKLPPAATADIHADPVWKFWFTLNAIAIAISFSALITYAFERPILKEGFFAHFKRASRWLTRRMDR